MSITINTNTSSLFLQNTLSHTNSKLNQSIERMTTGLKINRATDDAAALYVATGLSTRISSYEVGEDAVQTGCNMLAIAEGAITLITENILRVRDLAVQMANDIYTSDARSAAQQEVDARIEEIKREKDGCNFNGKKLLQDAVDTTSTTTTTTTTSSASHLTEDDFTGVTTETIATTTSSASHLTEDDFTGVTTETIGGVTFKTGTSKTDGEKYCLVEDIDQLNRIGMNDTLLSQNYVLMGDLDAIGISNFTPIGGYDYEEWVEHSYTGTFDGNGYAIENLTIDRSSEDFVGLFGSTSGTIKNIGVKDCNMRGYDYVGGLVGKSYGTIENCYVTGSVSGIYVVGGLVGWQNGGTIENCYATGSVDGDYFVAGGLVGYQNGCTIENCYATGSVSGNEDVGGLVGWQNGDTIENCYATGSVSGSYAVGGLVGEQAGGTTTNCYCKDPVGDSGAGEQKSAEWFASEDSAKALNNGGDEWAYVEDATHPILESCQEVPVPEEPDPLTSTTSNATRVQVGYDNTDNSCIYMDLSLTLGDIEVDLSTAESSAQAIETMDNLLKILDNKRTEIGAMQNRLQSVYESNVLTVENLSGAKSTIMDADMAEESSEYMKQQILQEAAASLLVQANQSPAIALQLISG